MLLPMSPTDSMFLLAESREHPMHVGGLQLFRPPEGADAMDVRRQFDEAMSEGEVAPIYRRRPRRSLTTAGQWGWDQDDDFDIEHHVRRNALPQPGRVLELLALCSRLHSTLLDRHRPLWETHLIEGLDDGRYAVYFKVHHSLMDGVSALRMLQSSLSADPDARDMTAPWAPHRRAPRAASDSSALVNPIAAARSALGVAADVAGIAPALIRTVSHSLREQASSLSFSAPRSMLNVPITGARRFAAQSWPTERFLGIARAANATLNDVVLALCSGALRSYLIGLDALPESSLIAMVPVSLRSDRTSAGGNSVGVIMCTLGSDRSDPAQRLSTVHRSMLEGKALLGAMSPTQIMAMSAIGMSPLVLNPLLRLGGAMRPPFNLVISNVPGPRGPMYWNGARLDGLYPLSIPLDGQALNITVTTYSDQVAFGLIGCRRSVPHLQRLLTNLGAELDDLEKAVGVS